MKYIKVLILVILISKVSFGQNYYKTTIDTSKYEYYLQIDL